MSLIFVHRRKTGGVAVASLLKNCTDIVLPGVGNNLHCGFRANDAITVLRHPIDRIVSDFVFRRSGTEFKRTRRERRRSRRNPIHDPQQLREVMGTDILTRYLYGKCAGPGLGPNDINYQQSLLKRLRKPYKTHFLIMDHLCDTIKPFLKELGYECSDNIKKENVSTHPHFRNIFSAEEITEYEESIPLLMSLYNSINNTTQKYWIDTQGGILQGVDLKEAPGEISQRLQGACVNEH